jgi:hypothetical protein
MTPPSHLGDDWEPSAADRDVLAPSRGLGLEGLLAMLERLDGGEEAAVVRSALGAGVPEVVVLEEVRREVERRLTRTEAFYDQGQW